MTDTIKDSIRAFIIDSFLFGDTSQAIADDMSLIDNNLVDSTGVLELVFFLESNFGISVKDTEVVPENLDSIGAMAAFIESKRKAAA
ncbi:MAG: acyl carrier protein [Devosia sp.]|uniref:acyl carrier protein n=1 Tax=unclassified Devosia TaxID=196773 RepID=UPI000925F7FA|nr:MULTISPECIES: acyl carrier protein [unclassified Devosia]MBL8599199.1 acyl carrier protein [Devosia sp.]MBN9345113.1 acyl carrier protein [Devosia sp.]OJX53020.1 MAG: acyl carrier protein [Devosia sp. 66-22]